MDERGARILAAAAGLILRFGYDKTTMSDVATEAAVSKSTLYQYWRSKDELFRALLLQETLLLVDDWLLKVRQDPDGGTLHGIYRHGYTALLEHPLMHALYTKESQTLGSYVRHQDPEAHVRPYLLNRGLVRSLQAAGLVRQDIREEVITHALMIISVGLFSTPELLPQSVVPPFGDVAEALAHMVQAAFAPSPTGDSQRGKEALETFLHRLITKEGA